MSPREQVQLLQLLNDWLYFSTNENACTCARCLASLLERTRAFLSFQEEHLQENNAIHTSPESHGQRRG